MATSSVTPRFWSNYLSADIQSRTARTLFWVSCLLIFSKIIWYDLGAYYTISGERRIFLTLWHSVWIVAQFSLFLALLPKLFRRISAPALFWALAVAPYFILGILYGRFGVYFIGDAARYALPTGWILLFSLLLPKLNGKEIIYALGGSLLICVLIRTGLHLALSIGIMRYGRHYEQLLVALLLLSPAIADRKYVHAAAAMAIIIPLSMILGNTRTVIGGMVAVAALSMAFTLFDPRFKWYQTIATVTASLAVIVLSGIALTGNLPGLSVRMDLTHNAAEPSYIQLASASDDVVLPSETEMARRDWEKALSDAGPRTLYDRVAEARYFLTAMNETSVGFWLGSGSGDSVTVELAPGHERVVRGAHNTFATLLYRHGAILGTALILFVSFYGLPTNIKQYIHAPSAAWQIIFASLITYRLVVILLAQMHQGLFDDPIVFLAIASAPTIPVKVKSTS